MLVIRKIFIIFVIVLIPSILAARQHKRFVWCYDLADHYSGGVVNTTNSAWLASTFDVVIGLQAQSLSSVTGERMPVLLYDDLKTRNPNIKLYSYSPFAAMWTGWKNYLEAWAAANEEDTEDLWYHYYWDATQTCTALGYIGGTAESMAAARVLNRQFGSCTYYNPCPTSTVFVAAFKALALDLVTVDTGKYMDGLYLDSFTSTVERYPVWTTAQDMDLHLTYEVVNTHFSGNFESQPDKETAYGYIESDMVQFVKDLQSYLRTQTGNPNFKVVFNAAEIGWYTADTGVSGVFRGDLDSEYHGATIEYYGRAGDTASYANIKTIYEDLLNSFTVYCQGQTSYSWGTDDVKLQKVIQANLAKAYLIENSNLYVALHIGSASSYSCSNGECSNDFYDLRWGFNLGNPEVQTNIADVWGDSNTNKFYILSSGTYNGSTFRVFARNFDNGMVVVKYNDWPNNLWANVGVDPQSYELGGTYYRVESDGRTSSSSITSITLGAGEGAILSKTELKRGSFSTEGAQSFGISAEGPHTLTLQ